MHMHWDLAKLRELFDLINELDIAGLMEEVRDVIKGANEQLADLNLKEINDNLTVITADVRDLTADGRIKSSLANLDEALREINKLSAKANDSIDPLLADIRDVTEKTRASLVRIEESAEGLSKVTDPRSPMLLEFQNLLHETENASRTLRDLTSDLKRNPGSLLRNKEPE
jgi:ABC-type transporter Mla subunit MlaD